MNTWNVDYISKEWYELTDKQKEEIVDYASKRTDFKQAYSESEYWDMETDLNMLINRYSYLIKDITVPLYYPVQGGCYIDGKWKVELKKELKTTIDFNRYGYGNVDVHVSLTEPTIYYGKNGVDIENFNVMFVVQYDSEHGIRGGVVRDSERGEMLFNTDEVQDLLYGYIDTLNEIIDEYTSIIKTYSDRDTDVVLYEEYVYDVLSCNDYEFIFEVVNNVEKFIEFK